MSVRDSRTALVIILSLLLSALTPLLLEAQTDAYFLPEIWLSTYTSPQGTSVTSSVRVTLLGAFGHRLFSEVIAGHGVGDLTTMSPIYFKRLVSAVGDPSEQVTMGAVFFHCYQTEVAAHANAYNLHEFWAVGPVCADPYVPEPPPKPDPPEENCPILLDLKQDGFHLSGPELTVNFDINADGIPDQIAWTKAGEDDAFLCVDRNGNGVIDDGRELFGYATPLLSGEPAQVGYRALADLDRPELGGNGDGKVDAYDNGFSDLCAWVDTNRDGVSQPGEIHPLAEVGVVALDYDYRTTGIRDVYDNLFRYASSAMMRSRSGAVRPWRTYDVIFAEP